MSTPPVGRTSPPTISTDSQQETHGPTSLPPPPKPRRQLVGNALGSLPVHGESSDANHQSARFSTSQSEPSQQQWAAQPPRPGPGMLQTGSASTIEMSNVQTIQSIAPTSRALPGATYRVSHPVHGDVTIERQPKSADSKTVTFNIQLQPGNGGSAVHYAHCMYVDNVDDEHRGHSTLGYADIFMPEEMQGKGIGYAYHAAAAQAARDLGVDRLVVNNCVSEPMRNLCENTGMSDLEASAAFSYAGSPEALIASNQHKSSQRGWVQA